MVTLELPETVSHTVVRYHTQSGSVYDVERGEAIRVRRVLRSSASKAERVAEEWRECASVVWHGPGFPLMIWWGRGRDEHSASADQIGTEGAPDAAVSRLTRTSAVVRTEDVVPS